MGYTNSRDTIKCWDLHTKKIKYCSSAKFDEYNNKFGDLWSPSSSLMNGTIFSAPPTLKFISQNNPL